MLKNWSKKKKVLVIVITAVVVVILGILSWIMYLNSYKPSHNIYFLEYENEYEKNDTIIFKYDLAGNKVEEIGRVSGYFYNAIINKEENRIIGYHRESLLQGKLDIIEYNIETGSFESKNFIEKIDELIDTSWEIVSLYDEGNKVLIQCTDKEGSVQLLSYNIVTEKNENVAVDSERIGEINQYLVINEYALWYRCGHVIYRYDWETQTEIKITDSPYKGVLEPEAGLIAYTEDIHRKKIYLYDIEQEKSKCIATGGWNIFYDDLFYVNAMWINDGGQFCYVKSFPGLFQEADTSLIVYDIKSGRRCCIYKVNATLHELRYILSSY